MLISLYTSLSSLFSQPLSLCLSLSFSFLSFSLFSPLSQDTLPSPLPIASLSKCYYTYCTTSDVGGTPVCTTMILQLYGSEHRILQYGSG